MTPDPALRRALRLVALILAISLLCLAATIILPLVPDVNYGPPPLDVMNPYKIWLMVVLISALNFASYLLVKIVGAEHERVVTGGGKASVGLPQFRAVNTFLGNLKRSLGGTYHAFDFAKYAHRYLAEAQYRFNRRFNLRSILARLLRAACLAIPTPASAIRAAEAGR